MRRALPWALLGGIVLGSLLRATVRDAVTGLGFVYYATPPILMAPAALVTGLVFAWRRSWRIVAVCGALLLLNVFWFAAHSMVAPPSARGARDVRVATWNAGRGDAGWERVAADIRTLDADVVALQEAGTDEPERRAFWAARFPDHERAFFGSGLVLLVRGRIVTSRKVDLGEDAKCALIEVEVNDHPLHVFMVDVKRLALTPRDSVFEKLDRTLAELTVRPLVILGDFNTPRDSVFFDGWRGTYQHAFETAGGGHDATWPLPFPVLAIDHVWCSRGVSVGHAKHRREVHSDHAAVVADLALTR